MASISPIVLAPSALKKPVDCYRLLSRSSSDGMGFSSRVSRKAVVKIIRKVGRSIRIS
jgi:hypothetical protein